MIPERNWFGVALGLVLIVVTAGVSIYAIATVTSKDAPAGCIVAFFVGILGGRVGASLLLPKLRKHQNISQEILLMQVLIIFLAIVLAGLLIAPLYPQVTVLVVVVLAWSYGAFQYYRWGLI